LLSLSKPSERFILPITAALLLALVGWSDVTVQNVAETYFLKRIGVDYLPVAFLISTALLAITSYGVGRLAARMDRTTLLAWLFLGLTLGLLPLAFLAQWNVAGSFVALILLSQQIKGISLLGFWVVMGDMFHARQAKRLFAPLMAGLTVGTITGSFASGPLGEYLGIAGLLFVGCGVLGGASVLSLALMNMRPAHLEESLGQLSSKEEAQGLVEQEPTDRIATFRTLYREHRLFRLLLFGVVCSGLLSPMIYLQFSYIADLATTGTGGEQRLLALYAQLRGWLNLAVLIAQLLAASWLYRHIGVPLVMALSPVAYLLAFTGLTARLSLTTGTAALLGTRLLDRTFYDSGLRILYNLFPESVRATATALLEGPVKRIGGGIGNVLTLAALAIGGTLWVSLIALPLVIIWLAASYLLWRRYPDLILEFSLARVRSNETADLETLLDPATMTVLSGYLTSDNLASARAAADLVSDAPPAIAVAAFARAAAKSLERNRPLLLKALDDCLMRIPNQQAGNGNTAGWVEDILSRVDQLTVEARVHAVRAYGRLAGGKEQPTARLERFLHDPVPAVRVTATAQLHGRGALTEPVLEATLAEAVRGDDALARRTGREELTLLLLSSDNVHWRRRLLLMAELLQRGSDRQATAEAIVEVASARPSATAEVSPQMLALRDDANPFVRGAVMRFIGHCELGDQTPWLLDHLSSRDTGEARAAREGLVALGPKAVNSLLVEHAYGKRSTRDAILSIVRDLDNDPGTLHRIYRQELQALRETLVYLYVLDTGDTGADVRSATLDLIRQRLFEQVGEGLHTAFLLLSAVHNEGRIREISELLQHTRSQRQRAVLVEALETLLTAEERAELLSLVESRSPTALGRAAASSLGIRIPSSEEVLWTLRKEPDEVLRVLIDFLDGASHTGFREVTSDVVGRALQLRKLPLFQHISTRELLEVTRVTREEVLPGQTTICREGEEGPCMYLIVDGDVEVKKGEKVIGHLASGDFFGEMAVFEQEARSATVITRGNVRLLRLDGADLLRLITELPTVAIGICEALTQRVQDMTDRWTATDWTVESQAQAPISETDELNLVEVMVHFRSVDIFYNLDSGELLEIARVASQESDPSGTVVIREGDQEESIYLVVKGSVRISKDGIPLADYGSGSFFGEMSLFKEGIRTATVTAQTPVLLLRLERNHFVRVMQKHPEIAISVCRLLSRRVRNLSEKSAGQAAKV